MLPGMMSPPLPAPTAAAAGHQRVLPENAPARAAIVAAMARGEPAVVVGLVQQLGVEGLYRLDLPLACRLVDMCVENKAWHLVIEGLCPCPAFPMDHRVCLHILQACSRAKRWHPALALLRTSMPLRDRKSVV
jgi:hypothetical protein